MYKSVYVCIDTATGSVQFLLTKWRFCIDDVAHLKYILEVIARTLPSERNFIAGLLTVVDVEKQILTITRFAVCRILRRQELHNKNYDDVEILTLLILEEISPF